MSSFEMMYFDRASASQYASVFASTAFAPSGTGTDQSLTTQMCSRSSPRRRSSWLMPSGLSLQDLPLKLMNTTLSRS